MTIQLNQIDWMQLDERAQQVIEQADQIIPLAPELEVSVMRIDFEERVFEAIACLRWTVKARWGCTHGAKSNGTGSQHGCR